eukprot:365047-Chlamydomonas_euryale.AAC.5
MRRRLARGHVVPLRGDVWCVGTSFLYAVTFGAWARRSSTRRRLVCGHIVPLCGDVWRVGKAKGRVNLITGGWVHLHAARGDGWCAITADRRPRALTVEACEARADGGWVGRWARETFLLDPSTAGKARHSHIRRSSAVWFTLVGVGAAAPHPSAVWWVASLCRCPAAGWDVPAGQLRGTCLQTSCEERACRPAGWCLSELVYLESVRGQDDLRDFLVDPTMNEGGSFKKCGAAAAGPWWRPCDAIQDRLFSTVEDPKMNEGGSFMKCRAAAAGARWRPGEAV